MDEKLEKIEKMKEIPKEVNVTADKKVLENLIIATFIMFICILFLIGYKYIEPKIYVMVLRILSIIVLIPTLFLIEIAYKKDDGKLALNSIEAIVVSFITLSLQYIYTYNIYNFPSIITFMAYVIGIYYSVKGIGIIYNERKKYRKSINDIEDITKERKN